MSTQTSKYYLGAKSIANLDGVRPQLVTVVHRCIEITPIDFCVVEGVRSTARQKEVYNTGASWTLKSKHLTGAAVDLMPLFRNKRTWHWACYFQLATAMRDASLDVAIPVKWGGGWCVLLADTDPEEAFYRYCARKNRKAKPDGAHFELVMKSR